MKLSFKVSARAARLIGRENVASAEGAIIELVKNCYDADASTCVLYFDNKYATPPVTLTVQEFDTLSEKSQDNSLLQRCYDRDEATNNFTMKKLEEKLEDELKKFFRQQGHLYVIDNGEGMTQKILEEHWMTIGTSNKENDIYTKNERVKTGAKGIGRFALDRLGNSCRMITRPSSKVKGFDAKCEGYEWTVDWQEFEGGFKVIDQVTADLSPIKKISLWEQVREALGGYNDFFKLLKKEEFKTGTIIEISDIRDDWSEYFIKKIYSNMEVLVPPKEEDNFNIIVLNSFSPEKYGKVNSSVCDDFDYKVHAKVEQDQTVNITITRREYDLKKLDEDLFNREGMQAFPYDKKTFLKGYYKEKRTLNVLIPGFSEKDKDNVFDKVGAFDFTFYFLKRATSKDEVNKFFYRQFEASIRKSWLDSFGGIKLFRDHFKVRPYGDVGSNSFDWLNLGERKAVSPAGIAKKGGGYKVNPNVVSGVINISRVHNIYFQDKSSREGVQENKVFSIFQRIILAIIDVFERDRSHIARELDAFFKEKNALELDRDEAEKIAKRIRNQKRTKDDKESKEEEEKRLLAALTFDQKEKIEELRSEQKLLRVLASSGIVMASFTHEFQNLSDKLSGRTEALAKLLSNYISRKDCHEKPEYLNPFILLDDIKNQDEKVKHWLDYSIRAARKDKRQRKNLDINSYLIAFKKSWKTVMDDRGVTLNIEDSSAANTKIRAFEIDLDSILNNLLVNTFDAFKRKDSPRKREINITLLSTTNSIDFIYKDSGPGLSKDIEKPNQIFEAFFTTKKDPHTGKDIGTGIGMWLVKSIVDDYDGEVELLQGKSGFGLKIMFPIKYKR